MTKKVIRKRENFKLSLAVFLMMFDEDKVLLVLRSGTGWMDGQYSLPGGVLEPRETVVGAVIREIKEEVGCEVKPDDLVFLHFMHNSTTGEEWVGTFFATSQWQGTPEIKKKRKHSELKWFPIDDLPKNMNPYVHQAIRNFRKGVMHSLFGWEIAEDSSEEDYLTYYSEEKYKSA